MDDHLIFGPSAPPRARQTTQTTQVAWNNSTAKALLQKDLAMEIIPLDGRTMGAQAVYASRPEYSAFPFEFFKRRLSTLRREAKSQNVRRADDVAAYARDRLLFPQPLYDAKGNLRWEGSAAENHLKLDIANGLHQQMRPRELHQTRAEYQAFDANIFRDHIYQEVKRRKFMSSFYGR